MQKNKDKDRITEETRAGNAESNVWGKAYKTFSVPKMDYACKVRAKKQN